MSKLKVSELFYSIQGEGLWMGCPSVFLRTYGCNFKCEGFGMPRGEKSNERNEVKVELYKNYKELPLVSTGCDSYASWDPRFKHLSPVVSTDSLAESIVDLLPHKEWRQEHLVITGGEPLLGWQRAYPALLDHPKMQSLQSLTFETNGTQKLTNDFFEYLDSWYNAQNHNTRAGRNITFSVSAKLPVSGEKWEDAIRPEVVNQYADIASYIFLKFVVASDQDVEDAQRAVDEYMKHSPLMRHYGSVYLMPVGGVESVYHLNNRRVAEHAMRLGWRYSDRLQVPLFKNEWGT